MSGVSFHLDIPTVRTFRTTCPEPPGAGPRETGSALGAHLPNVRTKCPASVDVSSETGVSLYSDNRTAWTTCPASVDAPPRGDDLLEVVIRLPGQRQELVERPGQQEQVADEHRGGQAGEPGGASGVVHQP